MEESRKTFLSYSRVNKDFAIRLANELKTEGFHVWLDQLDIPAGARWDREVEKALKESDIFMIILTQASVDSENVLDEIGYAIDSKKRFLPVLLENCEVPLRLRRFQYVDFTNKSFDEGVDAAKRLLRNLIEQLTIPPAETPAVPAIHVEEHKEQKQSARLAARAEEEPSSKPKVKEKPLVKASSLNPTGVSTVHERNPATERVAIGALGVFSIIIVVVLAWFGIRKFMGAATTPVPYAETPAATEPAITVTRVEYDKGNFYQAFVQGQSGAWFDVLVGDDYSYTATQYEEIGRDQSSIYLRDNSNNYDIQLDLQSGKIFEDYNDGSGKKERNAITGTFDTPTGYAVAVVRYPGGEFKQTDSQTWTETTQDNTELQYIEAGRDQWSVYLYDESRNFNVALDLYQMQILLDANDGNGRISLYQILSAENQ